MMSDRSVSMHEGSASSAETESKVEDSDIVLFHSTAHEVEDHQFTKTDPRSVFLLAAIAGSGAVLALAAAHWLMERSIDAGLIPPAPALQKFVD